MDIVERLRVVAAIEGMPDKSLAHEAAAEIERLRAELKARDGEIADWLDAVAGNLVPQQEKALRMAADNLRLGAYQMQKTV